MNKQKFMAELAKLLGFMSSRDRQAALETYSAMFDSCEDEQALLAELGTPTRLAIGLARDYVPSPVEVEPEETAAGEETSPVPADEESPVQESEPVPGTEAAVDSALSERIAEAVQEKIREELDEAPADEAAEIPPLVWGEETPGSEAAPKSGHRVRPVALVLYILLSLAVGLPIAVALIALGLPFLALGAGVVAVVVWAVLTLFALLSMVSDVLLVIGVGLVLLALGLLVAWLGLWISLELGYLWLGKVIFRLGGKLCFKKEKEVAAE